MKRCDNGTEGFIFSEQLTCTPFWRVSRQSLHKGFPSFVVCNLRQSAGFGLVHGRKYGERSKTQFRYPCALLGVVCCGMFLCDPSW